jgi:hypothetical protein
MVFVVRGLRIDGVCCSRCWVDGVCFWRRKDGRCLLFEVLGWMVFVVGVFKDGWRLLLEM